MKKVVIIALAAMFAGCLKDVSVDKPIVDAEKFENMVVPASFDWKMTADISCAISADHASLVTISATEGSEPLAIFVAGGDADQVTLSLPKAFTSVCVSYTDASGVVKSSIVPVSGGKISYDVPAEAAVMAAETRALGNESESIGVISYSGTLMFEDLWPAYGDYDFNDMVVGYNVDLDMQNKNKVERMTVSLRIKAVGGILANDFYLQMLGVEGGEIDEQKGGVQLLSSANAKDAVSVSCLNSLNNNGNPAIFHVSGIRKNINNKHTTYVNTMPGYEMSAADFVTVSFKVWFRNSIAIENISLDNFDFFIARSADGGLLEVHEGGYTPSIYGWTAYNSGVNDKVRPAAANYFSDTHLVWALSVPADIAHAYETVDFLQAYPRMAEWAQSGGTKATDWYKSGVSAYLVK